MIVNNSNWNFPTTIWFGNGRIKEIINACEHLNVLNPLFVTDSNLVNLDIVITTTNLLRSNGIKFSIYSSVQSNPTKTNVMDGVALYQKGGHDGVIAFGGGSALDAAKTIAFMSGQTRSLWDFEDIGDNWKLAKY